jgi:diketogulonate reductase-like aldo/keto reductase
MRAQRPLSPPFLYGTAWKEDETRRLVLLALERGFRGIDTANQRRHYDEAAVGGALRDAFSEGLVARDDVFLQTKFTHLAGQDHRLPYDRAAPIASQVSQSFASSLQHLGVEELDSYLLHGPSTRVGLHANDLEAWRAMEAIHAAGGTLALGVSNVSAAQLELLCARANVKPAYVQNRCFAEVGWDRDVRVACRRHGITYQGFSLLTANPEALHDREVATIARRHGRTPAQVVFRFAMQVGMLPLTGTTDGAHMREDLAVVEFELSPPEVDLVENVAERTR